MKLFLNRLIIILKQAVKQPIVPVMIVILGLLSVAYKLTPEKEKSMYIPVALLTEDDDPESHALIEDLVQSNSVFDFHEVSSREEIYQEITEKKADSAFIIPKGFMANVAPTVTTSSDSITSMLAGNDSSNTTNNKDEGKIIVIRTHGSALPSLAREEVFSHFFRYAARHILKARIHSSEVYKDLSKEELDQNLDAIYQEYLNGESIFRLQDASDEKYEELTELSSASTPIYQLSGFFIFAAALIGALHFLTNTDSGFTAPMTRGERISYLFLEVASLSVIADVIAYFAVIINYQLPPFIFLLRVLVYSLTCIIFASLFAGFILLITRKNRKNLYIKILPAYLVLTLIFSGVFFDIGKFSRAVWIVSKFFLPTYF